MMGEVIRLSGRATDAADLLREAMLSQRFADVTLCCPGGQRFLAHRLVLSAASPYLQEVLLDHSKCSACEPTTVILAEVEAPELAAILTFVYTGSAAVPRARLDGFLRAAEALRIRLPPIPPIVLDAARNLKSEDVKLAPEYLEKLQESRDKSSPVQSQVYRREESQKADYWLGPATELLSRRLPEEEEEYVDVTGFDQDYENLSTKSLGVGVGVGVGVVSGARMGEDLSCREGCCDWRRVKRRVANRVTASPWRQIVRVHHSPRIQRRLLQQHVDETILSVRVPVIERRSDEVCSSGIINETHLPPPRLDFPSTTEVNFYNPQPSVASNNFPLEDPCNLKSNERQKIPPRTPAKLEISHPVSRLCDTLDCGEKRAEVLADKSDEELGKEEKITSDDNNNNNNNNNDDGEGDGGDATTPSGISNRGKTAAEEHKCEECGKGFVTRASLKVHSRTHTGEKPFRCADCGKEFSQLRNYKYHRSVHEGTREFAATCPECGKYFNDRGYLSSHMKIHRNRKEYGCAECGKSFNQRVAYNMHVRIHTGVKPHQCEQCGKAFSRKMLLKQHLRTHSGERPYQCQVCHKAFADRSNMTLHTRLHSGLKPYQCTLCTKAFTKKHHLKTHLNYHTGTKPYSCANCGLRFSQSSNMRTHFKKCTLNNPEGLKPERKERKERNDVALTPPNSDQESSIITGIPL